MAMDFKNLAKLCAEAEENHLFHGKSGEPVTQIGFCGNQMKGKRVHILTGPENHSDLTGKPIMYVKPSDVTIIDIACRDIRAFYNSMNLTIEEFVDEIPKVLH